MRSFIIVMAIVAVVFIGLVCAAFALIVASGNRTALKHKEFHDAQAAEVKSMLTKAEDKLRIKKYITSEFKGLNPTADSVESAYFQLSAFVDRMIEKEPMLSKPATDKITNEDIEILSALENLRVDRSMVDNKVVTWNLGMHGFEETVDLFRAKRFLENEKFKKILMTSWKGPISLEKLYAKGIYIDSMTLTQDEIDDLYDCVVKASRPSSNKTVRLVETICGEDFLSGRKY